MEKNQQGSRKFEGEVILREKYSTPLILFFFFKMTYAIKHGNNDPNQYT